MVSIWLRQFFWTQFLIFFSKLWSSYHFFILKMFWTLEISLTFRGLFLLDYGNFSRLHIWSFFQIFLIFSLFLNFEDILKKCEFLYVSDLKRAKIWKYLEKVWVPVHYCSYIYQQGTYKISHQVIFDKFWLLLWKGASSCMFLALLLLTWNIQEHTLFGEKVWVLVCSCQTHIGCRNIQGLTPFHKKFSEKVWVPVRSWPIVITSRQHFL